MRTIALTSTNLGCLYEVADPRSQLLTVSLNQLDWTQDAKMSEPILPYDIPLNASGTAWSPHTWRTR